MRYALLIPPLLLAACDSEPENIQLKAENLSRQIEERANQIEAEADNGIDAAVAPLDNEAGALLNQIAGNDSAANGSAQANAQ